MYQAFDMFLGTDTWHTGHANDLERFNLALAKVVHDPNFNPDEMANYMHAVKDISKESEHPLAGAIENRRSAAWAVVEFLEATGAR